MSYFGGGYVPVRRGLMEHPHDGRMTPTEHHAFVSMLLLVNAATGTWRGSAPALTTILGYTRRNTMAEALDGLEAKGYILRDFVPGKRGNFPIVINKFTMTRGSYAGKRIDLTATKQRCGIPEGRLDKLKRQPLLAAISQACSCPVLVEADDHGVERGVERGAVSIRESREGGSEGGFEQDPKPPTQRSAVTVGQGEPPEHMLKAAAPPEIKTTTPADPQGETSVHPPPASLTEFPAAPTPQDSLAAQLAIRFLGYQGRPAKFDNSVTFTLWVSTFTRLIQTYGFDALSGAMEYAFNVDTFWPTLLIRPNNPIAYFDQKLNEQIMSRYLGWKKAQENLSKQQNQQQTRKETRTHDKYTRSSTSVRSGKQGVDNRAAAEEAKRRIAERLGREG